jgi:O-antigen ligase
VKVWSQPIVKIALSLMVLMCLSAPFALVPGYSVRFVLTDYGSNLLMMLTIAIAVRAPLDVERAALTQLCGCAFFCTIVILRFHVDSTGRLGNLAYYDANDFAMLAVCTLPLAIYFVRRPGKALWRLLAVAAVGLFMIGIVRSGSRGGFLGLIAVALTLLFTFRAVKPGVRFGVIGLLAVILSVTASDKYWGFIQTLAHPSQDYNWAGNSQTGRMEVWKRGLGYMAANPFLGVGPQNFPMAEGKLSPQALAAAARGSQLVAWMAAHNSYVQISAELGVFGITLFLLLLGATFRALNRLARKPLNGPDGEPVVTPALAQALRATMVGYVVTAFFLSQAYAGLLYSMLGIIMGLVKVNPDVLPVKAVAKRAAAMRAGATRRFQQRAPQMANAPHPTSSTTSRIAAS